MSSQPSSDIAPKDKSQNRFLKDAGYDNMLHFMSSFGLKMGNGDDLEEAKAIRKCLRQVLQMDWEANRK